MDANEVDLKHETVFRAIWTYARTSMEAASLVGVVDSYQVEWVAEMIGLDEEPDGQMDGPDAWPLVEWDLLRRGWTRAEVRRAVEGLRQWIEWVSTEAEPDVDLDEVAVDNMNDMIERMRRWPRPTRN